MLIELKNIKNYRPKPLLSARQEEVLLKALSMGYYEIPRKISLSNLAKILNISPSALSEQFRRIEKRLAKEYLF